MSWSQSRAVQLNVLACACKEPVPRQLQHKGMQPVGLCRGNAMILAAGQVLATGTGYNVQPGLVHVRACLFKTIDELLLPAQSRDAACLCLFL